MATDAGTVGSMAMPASKTPSSCPLISCYRAHGEARGIRTISSRAVIRATRSKASASIAASTMREHMYLRAVSSCAKSGSPSSARQSRRQHKYSDSIYCRETEAGPASLQLRSFFIGKKGVNSKQKVFSAMGSHAPGAQHLKTSFAVEQSVT